MGMIGAILGDIAGSQYEFEECRPKTEIDHKKCELFTDKCVYTDDTILTLALKTAVLDRRSFEECYRELAMDYRYVGYGSGFLRWMESKETRPMGSFGNGSAMRISFLADYYEELEIVQSKAKESAMCTHNHPEGIKGAVAAATCMWMAKHGKSKQEIYEYAVKEYPASEYEFGVERPLDAYRAVYKFDASCQRSIPVAIRCFLESTDYESCLRNAYSLHCDLDSVCCIGGAIAENFYGTTGFDNDVLLKYYLDDRLLEMVYR